MVLAKYNAVIAFITVTQLVLALQATDPLQQCLSNCVVIYNACYGPCGDPVISPCDDCVKLKVTCIKACGPNKRKRRHLSPFAKSYEHYKRKWMKYINIKKELGLQ